MPSDYEIRRVLNERDVALLSREFLLMLADFEREYINLDDIIAKMTLKAFNLSYVIPYIIKEYLLPNGLIEFAGNSVKITNLGLITANQLKNNNFSFTEIMKIIESKMEEESTYPNLVNTLKNLVTEFQEYQRPRVFFNIYPSKTNLLDMVVRNSGKGPAFDISIKLEPDFGYYDDKTLSDLKLFNNIAFLEGGQEIKYFYKSFIEVINSDSEKRTTVALKYRDSKNIWYRESYDIDLGVYEGLLMTDSFSISDIHKDLRDIVRQLENIQRRGILLKSKEDLVKSKPSQTDD